MSLTPVEGHIAPGFEGVRDVIESVDRPWGRGGGGISAYVDGELVVDVWGGQARPGQAWEQDTLCVVASVTKSWAALVVARLVERGVLDYATPLVQWWPEFGAYGKDSITLHDVFLHSSGVLGFDDQVALLDANDCAGWQDLDAIAAGLAAAKPAWPPGSQHGYHAVSFGWLLNEVVRRTTSRTIGEIFRSDIAGPLGLDAHLGTHGADLERVSRVLVPDLDAMPGLQRRLAEGVTRRGADPQSLPGMAFLGNGTNTILDRVDVYSATAGFLEAEIPASNGTATSQALARLFACLAAGGTLDGVTILEPATVEQLRKTRAMVVDTVLGAALPWPLRRLLIKPVAATYGLYPNPKQRRRLRLGPNPATFFSAGYGGQLVMADPDAQISMASICSDYTSGLDKLQPRVLDAIYAAV